MADILQALPIDATIDRVFEAVSTPPGLDAWWAHRSSGSPRVGEEYALEFGPEYDWRAKVIRCSPPAEFELELTRADDDWLGTRVAFRLAERDNGTWLEFAHVGWKTANDHYRISCHCWAMYLRILRRFLEFGETVAYQDRLSV